MRHRPKEYAALFSFGYSTFAACCLLILGINIYTIFLVFTAFLVWTASVICVPGDDING